MFIVVLGTRLSCVGKRVWGQPALAVYQDRCIGQTNETIFLRLVVERRWAVILPPEFTQPKCSGDDVAKKYTLVLKPNL